jgi:hypothetical protein
MAILCADYDLLFTHVPKTGGKFVERFLTEHVRGRRVGGQHASFRQLTLASSPSLRVFIVREPISWYRSYWAYQWRRSRGRAWPIWDKGMKTHPTALLDRTCGSPDFEEFALRVLSEFPNGFVRSMYCDFLNGASHVMRTSQLTEDFEALLRLVSFDRPSLVRDRPAFNVTKSRWKDGAVLSAETERRLREVDNLDGLGFPLLENSVQTTVG